ncbi:MAG: type I DNA topoisomerase [Bacteroidales bacterium]|nr:type I DNA topoisomerase [Bacteroidales bacterium]
MGKNLVIVESPGKTAKIQKFLGDEFTVMSSKGHVRDLDEKSLSVDTEHNFAPQYIIPADKMKVVAELKSAAAKADTVWLASDEDREGEAIAWHLKEVLSLQSENTRRIVFHEITETALKEAVKNPRDIDMSLVNAQQARRVLDRLVGFELSPVLWRKVQPKLSAGRVQSVALRLVVDREREIMAFGEESSYKVEGVFIPENKHVEVNATLDTRYTNLEQAEEFLKKCSDAQFRISDVGSKAASRTPAAPFTTSTLQQEASRKLHFSVSRTMSIAQSLYEKGFITYMRTDSTNLSSLAINTAKKFIIDNFGEEYSHVRQYKTKTKGAQEAHEAIRPTYIDSISINGTAEEKKLYDLIWKRTVACQMAEARLSVTEITVEAPGIEEKFVANATKVIFDGFLKIYHEGTDDDSEELSGQILPELEKDTPMMRKTISALRKFTQAPQRYTEASLIKKLEELGIGRPSTYAPTITTLTKGRGYIVIGDKEGEKIPVTNLVLDRSGKIVSQKAFETIGAEKRKLLPQEIGLLVVDYLVANFPDIVDYGFTANVEKDFDDIASGTRQWNTSIASFYGPFHDKVTAALSNKEYTHKSSREIGIDPSDGKMIVAKFGKFGAYIQKGDGADKVSASLGKNQLIDTITLEEALKLLSLPRTVGQYEGIDIIALKGRFGPYLKYGDKNVSLPRYFNPVSISLEECIKLINDTALKQPSGPIAVFGDIQVLSGRFGPYIKFEGANYKIPKKTDIASLDEAACREIIKNNPHK